MKLKTIMACISTAMLYAGATHGYTNPGCFEGSCAHRASWDEFRSQFCHKSESTCSCSYLESNGKEIVEHFDSSPCTSDSQCGLNMAYCDTGTGCCTACAARCTKSDTSWEAAGTGYEKRTTYTWTCRNGCTSTTEYRCAAGYYGNPTTTASNCTKCDAPGTSAAGTTSKSGCYAYEDDRGYSNDPCYAS